MNLKDKKFFGLFCILVIIIVSLILYFNPLFSNKPLGLDTLGHLSKVSYIKEFPFAQWDMAWYGGAPFLKFYSPLFYYLVALFPNPIFGANFLCFLSIVLAAIGIYLVVSRFSNKKYYGFISALLFLSVLNTSYYFISVGNQPNFFALFTIPFSMLFLEKSFENKKFFIFFSLTLFISIYSHIFIGLCVILISGLRLLLFYGINLKGLLRGLKLSFIFILPGILLSCFWLIIFLSNSRSYAGDAAGYIPLPHHLLGFGSYTIWGAGPGEIGISFALFLIFLAVALYKHAVKGKFILFLFIISIVLFFLLEGILGKYYPNGIGAIRFIMPFSIIICIFIGAVLSSVKIKARFLVLIFLVIIIGLVLNYRMINLNYDKYSYGDKYSRYWFMGELVNNKDFPLKNEFDNYRFGTTRYVFSETMNFFLPKKSQTFGYHDQGILYPKIIYLMKDKVWQSNDTNSTLYFLDWFGINYFEIGGEDLKFKEKFENSKNFNKIMSLQLADYPFIIYEYMEKTPLISLLKTNIVSYGSFDEKEIEKIASLNQDSKKMIPIVSKENITIYNNYSLLNFSFERKNPDKITIKFESFEKRAVVLFKEFYHFSWAAKELPSNKPLKIYKAGPGFMLVIPSDDAKEVVFYQKKNFFNYLGIILTAIGLLMLIIIYYKYPLKKEEKTNVTENI